jgi:hypothetical protein
MEPGSQADNKEIAKFLKSLLLRQLDEPASKWLTAKLASFKQNPERKNLYLTFSAVPRFLGKGQLKLSEDDLERAQNIRAGLNLSGWTVPQAARVLIVCSFPYSDPESFLEVVDQLFGAAEVSELVALYSALPVLPYPEKLRARASEGVRTNMSVVFDAVVLNNPYPSEYLDEQAWNQMVLKALFMGRPLYRIQGLQRRSNLDLSKMISDYAHERWAAGRSTSPEMWRPIGDQGTIGIYQDLEKLVSMEDPDQQAAAVLAARALSTRESQSFLDQHYSLVEQVTKQNISWDEIGRRWLEKQQN